jgi:hypothetical protein
MRRTKRNWKRGGFAVAAALTTGAVFQLSSCTISDDGVLSAFADPSGFADLGAQWHEDSVLGRLFNIDGSVQVNFGEED